MQANSDNDIIWNRPHDWKCDHCKMTWYVYDLLHEFKHFCPFCGGWHLNVEKKEGLPYIWWNHACKGCSFSVGKQKGDTFHPYCNKHEKFVKLYSDICLDEVYTK